jgi:S1-C subfamily serine protease
MRTVSLRVLCLLGALCAAASAQEARRDEDLAGSLEASYRRATEAAAPCVVAIKVDREPEPEKKAPPEPARPGRSPLAPPGAEDVFARRPADAWCSGTIVEPGGVILTTHFNVAGRVRAIRVRLPDGRELPGRLLGYNADFDLAAVKIEAEGLPVLERSRLEDLKVGQAALVIGRGPDGRGLTVNPGIVSSPTCLAGRGVQTDAKLNFGNVGGPLIDPYGRLLAVTCKVDTKYSSQRGQNSGVGFAIAHDRLPALLARLKAGEKLDQAGRTYLGIIKGDGATDGVEVSTVQPGGAAEKAGMKKGDVILEFDGHRIEGFDELRAAIQRRAPGDKVKIKVRRQEQVLELQCELGWDPGE